MKLKTHTFCPNVQKVPMFWKCFLYFFDWILKCFKVSHQSLKCNQEGDFTTDLATKILFHCLLSHNFVEYSTVTRILNIPNTRCFSNRTYLLDWDLTLFTSVVETWICEDDDWSNSKIGVLLAVSARRSAVPVSCH